MKRLCVLLCILLVLTSSAGIFADDRYPPAYTRADELSLGVSGYMLPLPMIDVLKVSPFGIGATYGLTDRLSLTGSFAPLNYYTLRALPDMIEGESYLFVYIAEAGLRYHFNDQLSSFYIEADAASLGIFGTSTDSESALNDAKGATWFTGAGFGFSGPAGRATLSVGLHAYYWLGESDVEIPIPLIKVLLLW